jgi:hypothetical protein
MIQLIRKIGLLKTSGALLTLHLPTALSGPPPPWAFSTLPEASRSIWWNLTTYLVPATAGYNLNGDCYTMSYSGNENWRYCLTYRTAEQYYPVAATAAPTLSPTRSYSRVYPEYDLVEYFYELPPDVSLALTSSAAL